MRKMIVPGLLLMVAFSACGDDDSSATTAAPTTSASTATTAAVTTTASTTTTLPERSISVVSLSGDTEATVTDSLSAGDAITTGEDGTALLETDDGTIIVVVEGSAMSVARLSWAEGAAETVLALDSGGAAAIRQTELPAGAVFEIETPSFTAGLSGSGVAVDYGDEGAGASCLFGECYVRVDGETTDLAGNEWLDLAEGAVATRAAFDAARRTNWSRALQYLRENAGGFDACECDERSLLCEGTTEVPFFPGCPDDTECTCNGPDLLCEDGRTFEDDQQCMAEIVPLAELIVPDFSATYDCIEAHTRWKIFDPPLLLSEIVLRPYEDEATGCEYVATFTPVTYSLQVADDGTIAGMSEYEDGSYDVEIVDDPSARTRSSIFGPRFGGGSFTIYGWTGSGDGQSSETTDAVMTQAGEETITILGESVRALVYEGTYTGHETWVSENRQTRATTSWEGTWTVWFDAVTGLELRSEQEAFFTDCTNCGGSFIGLRQTYALVELVATNQPLNPGS